MDCIKEFAQEYVPSNRRARVAAEAPPATPPTITNLRPFLASIKPLGLKIACCILCFVEKLMFILVASNFLWRAWTWSGRGLDARCRRVRTQKREQRGDFLPCLPARRARAFPSLSARLFSLSYKRKLLPIIILSMVGVWYHMVRYHGSELRM